MEWEKTLIKAILSNSKDDKSIIQAIEEALSYYLVGQTISSEENTYKIKKVGDIKNYYYSFITRRGRVDWFCGANIYFEGYSSLDSDMILFEDEEFVENINKKAPFFYIEGSDYDEQEGDYLNCDVRLNPNTFK